MRDSNVRDLQIEFPEEFLFRVCEHFFSNDGISFRPESMNVELWDRVNLNSYSRYDSIFFLAFSEFSGDMFCVFDNSNVADYFIDIYTLLNRVKIPSGRFYCCGFILNEYRDLKRNINNMSLENLLSKLFFLYYVLGKRRRGVEIERSDKFFTKLENIRRRILIEFPAFDFRGFLELRFLRLFDYVFSSEDDIDLFFEKLYVLVSFVLKFFILTTQSTYPKEGFKKFFFLEKDSLFGKIQSNLY